MMLESNTEPGTTLPESFETAQPRPPTPGGFVELLRLSIPLILTSSALTIQITLDRIMLSRFDVAAVGAAMSAVMLFWTPVTLLQNTASYATTFVAQYVGAGRPERVGPVVWQALWVALVGGILLLGMVPLADYLVLLGGHSETLRTLEADYLRTLCFAGFPTLVVAAASSFFAGRGASWTVLLIDVIGLVVNGTLVYGLVFGNFGLPRLGIAGAGWATVAGSSTSALVALGLFLFGPASAQFQTRTGWRLDLPLLRRLLRYGLPNGIHWSLDALAFTVFLFLIGRLGDAELTSSSIAFTLNLTAILPAFGISQGVAILVGQRLGQDRPDLAERSTWSGFALAWGYMAFIGILYVTVPGWFLALFQDGAETELNSRVAVLVPWLLRFVAVYSLFDSMNVVFAFALKGAGDTRFVTVVSLALAWPVMVLPSWGAWYFGWGLGWAWTFASSYVILLGCVFLWRFRGGKWKSMRVIEMKVAE